MNILAFYGGINRDCNDPTPILGWWNHGASATLISDGKYIGSYTEERFTRIKLDGNYPVQSINHLLDKANLSSEDIDVVTYTASAAGVDMILNNGRLHLSGESQYVNLIRKHFPNCEVHYINHHDAHSACSFFGSGFESANVFSFDGGGDYYEDDKMTTASFNVVDNHGDSWGTLAQGFISRKGDQDTYTLGEFYTWASLLSFCMVKRDSTAHHHILRDTIDGKIMGLAAYGDASKVPYKSPFKIRRPPSPNGMPCIEVSKQIQKEIENQVDELIPDPNPPFAAEDFAAWQQHVFQSTLLEYFQAIPKAFLRPNLCLGGGCALNILANTLLTSSGIYDNVFIHPATGDEGLSFGAAMMVANRLGVKVELPTNLATVGPSYSNDHARQVIESCKDINFRQCGDDDYLYNTVADALQDNKIVAWFQGCSEYGPRALGNRSIFANPAFDNKDLLNTRVKHRESWRPYAAIMIQEDLHEWVDIPREMSEYMLFASYIKSNKMWIVPGIVHEDGSCRIQTVTPELNDRAYRLLEAFNARTDIPMLLNTSFNTIPNEPIVETPYDAIKSFLHSNIDLLVINDFIITKK